MTDLILDSIFFNNSIKEYLFFLSTLIIALIFKKLLSKYFSHLLYKLIGKKETSVGVDKFNELLTKPIGFFVMLSVIYIGASQLQLPSFLDFSSDSNFGGKSIITKTFS